MGIRTLSLCGCHCPHPQHICHLEELSPVPVKLWPPSACPPGPTAPSASGPLNLRPRGPPARSRQGLSRREDALPWAGASAGHTRGAHGGPSSVQLRGGPHLPSRTGLPRCGDGGERCCGLMCRQTPVRALLPTLGMCPASLCVRGDSIFSFLGCFLFCPNPVFPEETNYWKRTGNHTCFFMCYSSSRQAVAHYHQLGVVATYPGKTSGVKPGTYLRVSLPLLPVFVQSLNECWGAYVV